MGRARVFSRECKVLDNLTGFLAPTAGDGVEPAGLLPKSCSVADQDAIVSGMAGRYATALFELALEQGAVDTVEADLGGSTRC